MTKELLEKIKALPKLRLLIILFTVWQYLSVAGMAVLHWPDSLVWLNLGLLLAFVVLSPVYESLLLLVLSIPFSVAVPNHTFEALPMWRILYAALFMVWLARDKKFRIRDLVWLPWDKYLAWFAGLGLLSAMLFGQFRVEAIKQVLFWLNIYCMYLVLVNTLKNKQQIFELIRYVIWSLAIIVTLGFAQLIGTFLTDLDTFWVFWAVNITKLYYGASLAGVSLYSNSWFSYSGTRELRMFSIMPDSQSFAYVCLIALCMGTALTRSVFKHIKKWLWSGIRFAALGLMLSGTRAVWAGMVAPFLAVAVAHYKNFQKHLARKFLIPFLIIFALFAVSPIFNRGLAYIRVGKFQENFLVRATSIYNLQETSNQGRLAMWAESAAFAARHPWGVGFGNFIMSLSQSQGLADYNQASARIVKRYNLPAKYVSAHSLYLQVLVEAGLLGFLAFALFWLSAVRYFWTFVRHHKHAEDFLVYFVAQALLMLLWILAAAVFDVTLFNDKVLMYFFLNLGVAGLIVKRYHEYEENVAE
ncbi:MAG: O-antigen ligase family protein [Patescibacteria group bacterium]|nr:O-antigen ligase family protein [Patescibacteria group bacterium]